MTSSCEGSLICWIKTFFKYVIDMIKIFGISSLCLGPLIWNINLLVEKFV